MRACGRASGTLSPDSFRMSAHVPVEHLHVAPRDAVPARWAAELAAALVPALPEELAQLAQDRVVELDEGILLAHLRTGLVQRPTVGGWLAPDGREGAGWLRLVAILPEAEPGRHLAWLAHLATVLREDAHRALLRGATTPLALAALLEDLLDEPISPSRRLPAVEQRPGATHRLIAVVVKDDETLDHLLTRYAEHEVSGATVLEAQGMAEHLAAHLSLFAGFRSAFRTTGQGRLVLAVVPAARGDELLDVVRDVLSGEVGRGGIAWAMEVGAVVGLGDGG